MTPLLGAVASRPHGTPTVWCDWYRRPAATVQGRCVLCKSRMHRPWQETA